MVSSNTGQEEGEESIRIELQELGNTVRLLGSKPGERVLLLGSPGFILPESLRYLFFLVVDHASQTGVVIDGICCEVHVRFKAGEIPGTASGAGFRRRTDGCA